MWQTLFQVILLALAAALSSVPITATIVILVSESRSRSGLAFLAGMVLGTFAAASLATVASQALPGRPLRHDALVGKLEVVIGVALVVLGVVTLVRRGAAASGRPGWLDGIAALGLLPVFGIGLALSIRPKGLLLVAATGLALSSAHLPFTRNLLLVVLYTAVATATVVLPIVATILFPHWMEPRLLSARAWITAHAAGVRATIPILVGGFVIVLGLSG